MADGAAFATAKAHSSRPIAHPKTTEAYGPGEWAEFEPKELLRRLAIGNIANFTGTLDYLKGRNPAVHALDAVTPAFCDNFLLRVAVPDYHITIEEDKDGKSKKYTHLGHFMTLTRQTISEYTDATGVSHIDLRRVLVKPVPMTPFCTEDRDRLRRFGYHNGVFDHKPHRHVESGSKETQFFWQNIKVSCQDADLQKVIDLIRSGVFNAEKLYFKDFDTTIDCAGTFVRRELFHYLHKVKQFAVRGKKFRRSDGGSTLLDNESDVGNNCLTWMTNKNGPQAQAQPRVARTMTDALSPSGCPFFTFLRVCSVAYPTTLVECAHSQTVCRHLHASKLTLHIGAHGVCMTR